ncbi:MAG: hypothetical protein ACE5NA_07615, partial [Nitrospiraceae bacterium]
MIDLGDIYLEEGAAASVAIAAWNPRRSRRVRWDWLGSDERSEEAVWAMPHRNSQHLDDLPDFSA